MPPRCVKPKCLKRIPIYIPVHRPCLDSLHLPISRLCLSPYFNERSSCIHQNHPVCSCRDQNCSVKICNPTVWTRSNKHFCKAVESTENINTEDSDRKQCKILDGGNLNEKSIQEIVQTNSKDNYVKEKNENINEVVTSRISNTQKEQDCAKKQPLPKMPLNRGKRQSKTSDTIIRSRDDSRSNLRHVGSTVVPETSCKGIQVSGPFPQNEFNRTQNLSRNNFTSEYTNGREPYHYITCDNRRKSLIETDHFNQQNVNSEGFYNNQNIFNPCCQPKYIQVTQRNSVDLLNNGAQTSNLNNMEYPTKENDERFIRPPRDTYGSGTSRPLANLPREHLVSSNRYPTEYTSRLMKRRDTKEITSPVQSQTGFNPVQNQSYKYTLNGKTNSHGRNGHATWNNLQSKRGSREMAPLQDIDRDSTPSLQNLRQNLFQQKPCCKESAEQKKPVMKTSGIREQKFQSNDGFSETRSSSSKEKGCCNHGISELVNKRGNMGHENQLGKLTKNVACACSDKGAEIDMKSTKTIRDGQIDRLSRASVGCTDNQGTKCQCCYPPSFKQFSCAGNINGNCKCDD